jgi:hypothetical protein
MPHGGGVGLMLVFTQDVIRFKSEKHGTYTAMPEAIDKVATRCLSQTVAELRAKVRETTGYETDWSDVKSWSALVIILASFEPEVHV